MPVRSRKLSLNFFLLEGEPPVDIFKMLQSVAVEALMGYISVQKWVSRITTRISFEFRTVKLSFQMLDLLAARSVKVTR